MADASEQIVKGYQLNERLGEGGAGVVYRATQLSVGREVAIKAILPVHANSREFIRRFEREAQLVARRTSAHCAALRLLEGTQRSLPGHALSARGKPPPTHETEAPL